MPETNSKFIPIWSAAKEIGVPAKWLEREAKAGRVPAVVAGRSLLCDPVQVREYLAEQAMNRCSGQIGGAA